ncbi:hypothetical protein TNCV_3777811 [Trichonephila clavipes]|nr:hypothetical protein TNCV_3777811 [Trichonephila clavipes]
MNFVRPRSDYVRQVASENTRTTNNERSFINCGQDSWTMNASRYIETLLHFQETSTQGTIPVRTSSYIEELKMILVVPASKKEMPEFGVTDRSGTKTMHPLAWLYQSSYGSRLRKTIDMMGASFMYSLDLVP